MRSGLTLPLIMRTQFRNIDSRKPIPSIERKQNPGDQTKMRRPR